MILDEFLGLLDNRMVSQEDLDSLMAARSEDTEIMFTGRVMSDLLDRYVERIYKIS